MPPLSTPAGKFAAHEAMVLRTQTCVFHQQQLSRGRVRISESYSRLFLCEAGTYSRSTGARSCTSCGAGQYAEVKGESSCSFSCAAGKSSSVTGASSATVCVQCAAGFYSSDVGASLCSSGYAQADSGSTSCQQCFVGYWSPKGSSSCTCIRVRTSASSSLKASV